jgi:hypothetical protein
MGTRVAELAGSGGWCHDADETSSEQEHVDVLPDVYPVRGARRNESVPKKFLRTETYRHVRRCQTTRSCLCQLRLREGGRSHFCDSWCEVGDVVGVSVAGAVAVVLVPVVRMRRKNGRPESRGKSGS